MMKRFPRSLIFVGDHTEVPLGRDYTSWCMEACSKVHEHGMPNVFDAGRLFKTWPRWDDRINFRTTDETDDNIWSLTEAVLRLASNLFPWEGTTGEPGAGDKRA